jgi:uncharacterized protein (DUF362 family)
MKEYLVSVVRYRGPYESVKRAVELCGGFDAIPRGAKVFVKPNIVNWTRFTNFPKWGVITTSRVVEDTVRLLKDLGINDITIGEGIVTATPKDKETPAHAFETLGYNQLKRRYGVKVFNIFERPFQKVDLGDGITLNYNLDILNCDYIVDLPVLKTHAQAIVSLSIKNLKGTIDINSRKKCHSPDPNRDLHFHISRLADKLPPAMAIIDGIYSNERGPSFDGRLRRTNLLIASGDLLSADMVGAKVLGYEPSQVPHLVHAAGSRGRPSDMSDIKVVGEKIEDVASFHDYDIPYVEGDVLPAALAKRGIKGITYRKYDLTMCTYCSGINGVVLAALARAWKGEPWDDVEVLTGKAMKPTPGKKKTILLGKCMYQANKDDPNINEMIAVKGCPPSSKDILSAFHQAGIDLDPAIFENIHLAPGFFLKRYEGNPDFDESFFRVS